MKPKLSKQIASALSKCRKMRLDNGSPAFDQQLLKQAHWHLERAERDCRTLDESGANQGFFFLQHLHEGLADTNAALRLRAFLTFPADGRKMRKINKAFRESETAGKAAYYLHYMRELIRDRYPANIALKSIPSAFIRARCEAGDVHFFEQLGSELKMIRTLPRRYERSIEEWLRRVWVTLCLWRYDTAKEAWTILKQAVIAGGMLKEMQHLEGVRGWGQFAKAWRNLRARRR